MAGVVAIVGRANVGKSTVWLEKEFQLLKMLQV